MLRVGVDMKTKLCSHCKKRKLLKEFHKDKYRPSGRTCQCRKCRLLLHKEIDARYYKKHQQAILARLRNRRRKNPEKFAAAMRRWRNKHLALWRERQTKYNRANKLRVNARTKLIYWKNKGVIKQKPCIVCGSLKSEAHHCDYKKPLEVMWMCKLHHKAWHRIFLTEATVDA